MLANSPPTRGDSKLDILATNFDSNIKSLSSHQALENEAGVKSDHSILLIENEFEHIHQFTKICYSSRKTDEEARSSFLNKFTEINWENLIGDTACPSEMTVRLHNK